MNAAVGAAAADVPVTDWMYAALPTQIVNEPWELQGALEVLWAAANGVEEEEEFDCT